MDVATSTLYMHRSNDVEGTYDISCDLDPKAKVKGHMYFLVDSSPHKLLEVATSKFYMCIGHMMLRVLGNTSCDLDVGVKVK